MNRKCLIPLLSGLALLICLALTSCSSARRKAEEAVQRGEYYRAAELYRDLYRSTPARSGELRAYYAWRAAEQYARLGTTTRALSHYQQAERHTYPDSLLLLRLGQQYHQSGQWSQAIDYYRRYLAIDPESHLAQVGLAGCETALLDTIRRSRYEVVRATSLGSSASDYAPSFSGDGQSLYFSSHRSRGGLERSQVTGESDGDLYTLARTTSGQWTSKPDTLRGAVNTDADEGTPAISSDGGKLYYTYAESNDQYDRTAQIYVASSSGEAGWGRGQRVDVWRDTLTMAAHPSLSGSGRTLYFVSDAVGGYGGKDLYAVTLDANMLGTPRNLGVEINTPGNELYPHAVGDSTLYFASNGRASYGGLDLYKAILLPSGQWEVLHLPAPINSPADDYGIAFDPRPALGHGDSRRILLGGFFSSTRDDGRGRPHLYSFVLPAITTVIEGYVLDREEYAIAGATVRLLGNTATAREQIATTREDGSYRLEVEGDVDYVMLASAPGYLNQYARLHTDSAMRDETYWVDFSLASRRAVEQMRNVYYAFDSAEILPESQEAVTELVRILTDNPDIRIILTAHADRHGSDEYNVQLSSRRAASVVTALVAQGIDPSRLQSEGRGQRQPLTVTAAVAERYPFLSVDTVLTPDYIATLESDQQSICDALCRRTEFAVLTDE